jgi:hypothetical protein
MHVGKQKEEWDYAEEISSPPSPPSHKKYISHP